MDLLKRSIRESVSNLSNLSKISTEHEILSQRGFENPPPLEPSLNLPCVLSTVGQAKDYITKTRLFKYIEIFTSKKLKISDKTNIFHISAQNIDCGYSFEPPRRGDSNEYPQSMCWAEIRK